MESFQAKYETSQNDILLSICIPTYNSSNYLRNALNSIVNQKGFDQRCEIIISDNNSEDDTAQMIAGEFISQYKNIRYYCNEQNIGDKNFIVAMNYAAGKYIKLHSDKWCFLDNTLSDLLNRIQKSDDNVIILLNNNVLTDSTITHCNDFNQFVSLVSYWSTWITGIIYKNVSYKYLENKERCAPLQLAQTDILFRLLRNSSALIINGPMMTRQVMMESKGGYNIFKVFLDNYLYLYQDYLKDGSLNYQTYRKEKINLLTKFVFQWYTSVVILRKKKYSFERTDALRIIFKHYKKYPQLYLYPIFLLKAAWDQLIRVNFTNKITNIFFSGKKLVL